MTGRRPIPAKVWAAVLVLAVAATYANSLGARFVFDDHRILAEDRSIRSLWPLTGAMKGAPMGPTDGRPLAALSMAVNYAFGGREPFGYHLFNVAVHAAAALALFGLVRRTLLLPALRERYGAEAAGLAFVAALLWALHPLQTECVAYVTTRTESMMGMFYLLTLYGFARGADDPSRVPGPGARLWFSLSAACCALGLMSKEVMITAPAAALLYDRAFLSGTWGEVFRRRWGAHAALWGSWLLLPWILGDRFALAREFTGFGMESLPPWRFWLTQAGVLLHYLRLGVCPHPLVVDYYDWPIARDPLDVLPGLAAAAALAVMVGWAWVRRPALGFLGAFPLLVLAPTLVLPQRLEVAAERRMYLPSAAVMALAVLLLREAFGRLRREESGAGSARPGAPLALAAAALLGCLTFLRNGDYRSEVRLWEDAVVKRPGNARAHVNLGVAYWGGRRMDLAGLHFREALRLDPSLPGACRNYGMFLLAAGNPREAEDLLREAVRLAPWDAKSLLHLGSALRELDRDAEAEACFREAAALAPSSAAGRLQLSLLLSERGEAEGAFREALLAVEADPEDPVAHNRLGSLHLERGDPFRAESEIREAVRLDPEGPAGHVNLGTVLWNLGRIPEAVAALRRVLALAPGDRPAKAKLAMLLAAGPDPALRDPKEALRLAEEAVGGIESPPAGALDVLGMAQAACGRFAEAAGTAERAAGRAEEEENGALAAEIRARAEGYRAGKPYLEER